MNLFSQSRSRIFAVAILSVACSSGTEPKVPKSIDVAGSLPSGTAGLTLTSPPTFSVKDGSGAIMGGIAITITVTSGGGTLTNAPTTTVEGAPTPIGTLTLGRVAGPNVITVTV